ncbi:uncharacterized protein TNCV_170801 [Trichonephila clavipes]|nr:uncharacterized protein TNCV_170801 [Trichonephila clavipes]
MKCVLFCLGISVFQFSVSQKTTKPLEQAKGLVIFCDSKAALQAILNITEEICSRLFRLQELDKVCFLQWLPGHVDITCNENADKLAKEARNREDVYDSLDTFSENILSYCTRNGNGLSGTGGLLVSESVSLAEENLKIVNFENCDEKIRGVQQAARRPHVAFQYELWFQQDGATCHTARATIYLLKDTFGDRLISRFGPVNWPPRSCDLTQLDYFLWGYVKSLIYADKPQTLDHLEDNIRRVIADIRPQMLEKVIENWTSRLDYI